MEMALGVDLTSAAMPEDHQAVGTKVIGVVHSIIVAAMGSKDIIDTIHQEVHTTTTEVGNIISPRTMVEHHHKVITIITIT